MRKEWDVEYPKEYFEYKLSGAVIHMGSADRCL